MFINASICKFITIVYYYNTVKLSAKKKKVNITNIKVQIFKTTS